MGTQVGEQNQSGISQRDLSADIALQRDGERARSDRDAAIPTTRILFSCSDGIGDTSFMFSGWLWNPKENKRGNVQIGFGLQIPTGNDNVITNLNGKPTVNDYSIQPRQRRRRRHQRQWAAYKNVPFAQLYFNGSYLATPQNIRLAFLRKRQLRRASRPTRIQLDLRSISAGSGRVAISD